MKPGDVPHWQPDTDEGLERAKAFVADRGLSQDDVSLVRRHSDALGQKMIMVVVKRECVLRIP